MSEVIHQRHLTTSLCNRNKIFFFYLVAANCHVSFNVSSVFFSHSLLSLPLTTIGIVYSTYEHNTSNVLTRYKFISFLSTCPTHSPHAFTLMHSACENSVCTTCRYVHKLPDQNDRGLSRPVLHPVPLSVHLSVTSSTALASIPL